MDLHRRIRWRNSFQAFSSVFHVFLLCLVNCPGFSSGGLLHRSPDAVRSGGKWEAYTVLPDIWPLIFNKWGLCVCFISPAFFFYLFFSADGVCAYVIVGVCVSSLISLQRNTIGTVPNGWNSLDFIPSSHLVLLKYTMMHSVPLISPNCSCTLHLLDMYP